MSAATEKELRRSLAAYPDLRPVVPEGARFPVYVQARPERAAVLIRLPRLAALDDNARQAVARLAWGAATTELRTLRLVGARRVALCLRDSGPCDAVTLGDLTDELPPQSAFGSPADTAPIAAFFSDERLPLPMTAPSPGSAAARLLDQRSLVPLRSTGEWRAYVGPDPGGGSEARQRAQAIRRYLTAEDVESLLGACEGTALPTAEARAALSLLGDLAIGYDARITADQERRLAAVLRRECLERPPGTGGPCMVDVQRLWARLDRPFLEDLPEAGRGQGMGPEPLVAAHREPGPLGRP